MRKDWGLKKPGSQTDIGRLKSDVQPFHNPILSFSARHGRILWTNLCFNDDESDADYDADDYAFSICVTLQLTDPQE